MKSWEQAWGRGYETVIEPVYASDEIPIAAMHMHSSNMHDCAKQSVTMNLLDYFTNWNQFSHFGDIGVVYLLCKTKLITVHVVYIHPNNYACIIINQQSLSDVVACNRNPTTNMVEALDAWNIQGYGNVVDAIQDVQRFSGTYSGGRITCRYINNMNISYTNGNINYCLYSNNNLI